MAGRFVNPNGFLANDTFSDHDPKKCSGLDIKQYSESKLGKILTHYFRKIRCLTEDHVTPSAQFRIFFFVPSSAWHSPHFQFTQTSATVTVPLILDSGETVLAQSLQQYEEFILMCLIEFDL